jgi:ABC-type nickel/cobalt efflux system permease component RcnA
LFNCHRYRAASWSLASEVRAGGFGALALAFALGALHVLTPGHGKSVLTAYFLGKDVALTFGIATTIGLVPVSAILSRKLIGSALAARASGVERWGRIIQGIGGGAIAAIGIYTLIANCSGGMSAPASHVVAAIGK